MSKTLLTVLITIWSCGVVLQFLLYWALPTIVKFFVKTMFPEEIFKNAVEESYQEMKEEWDKEAWSLRDISDILLWPIWLPCAVYTYLVKSKKENK